MNFKRTKIKEVSSVQISYYEYLKDAGVYKARTKLINCWKKTEENVTETARLMGATRKTVRKVRDLYLNKGWKGIKDSRNGPKKPHNKIGPAWEYLILSEYQQGPVKTVTSFRLWFNNKYDTTFSKDVFYRITKEERRTKKSRKRKKDKKKAFWREKFKKKKEILEHWQLDPKYLDDIEYFLPQMVKFNLPRYQVGIREVVTGSTFFFYTYELNANVMQNGVARFLNHFKNFGLPMDNLEIQTDNDATMVCNQSTKRRGVTKIIEDVFQADHSQIPPGACWKQGYIESFNNLCEQHFYKVESFSSLSNFLSKAYTYQLAYNLVRQSESLGKKSPYQIAKKYYPGLTSAFYQLPPVVYNGSEAAPKIVGDPVSGGYLLQPMQGH